MNRIELEELLNRYRKGECSAEELELLQAQIFYAGNKPVLSEQELKQLTAEIKTKVIPLVDKSVKKAKLWPRYVGAAAAVAAIAFGIWFYNVNTPASTAGKPELVSGQHDIAPGKNLATLKLPDGSLIPLSETKTGITVSDKELAYNDGTKINALNTAGEQTIVTPRGGTYQVTLPDGTHVWLNAASSLTYSAALKERGAVRRVKLSGEAYFEVAKDKTRPFKVESDGQEITVLGTHFNVNAYNDENGIKTTLLEGSVSVRVASLAPTGRGAAGGEGSVTLRPNQQALVLSPSGRDVGTTERVITVKNVNPEEAVAWKQGVFIFNSTPLDQIMRTVARWYNVDIVYENPELKAELMGGSVSRYDNVSRILKTLENTGAVKFKIDGRKVIVSK